MDGNGRWAAKRYLPRSAGHRAGGQNFRKIADAAEEAGVKYLTVYALSTENWSRPREEVDALMKLLREYLQQYIDDTKRNNMKITVIGDKSRLEPDLREKIDLLQSLSADKTGLQVNIAINYGGRDDIVRAARRLARMAASGELRIDEIDEARFAAQLDTSRTPDPDLLIRTGGDMRVSNFLLWQIAYSEIFISDRLWPDFSATDLNEALEWFATRDRRFGKTE
jgi:undecaprenyl diphosphate synthase